MDTFSSQKAEPVDFTLTLKSAFPSSFEEGKQFSVTPDGIAMRYGTADECVCLDSDRSLRHWDLYTTMTGFNIDNWFGKVGNLFCWAVSGRNAVVLHGALLEWQGKGILLTAASGTGKTTHARLWRDHENALIINGDRVLLRKDEDLWYAYGIPWCGSSGECVNRRVPLGAVVFLARGDSNQANRIQPLCALDKIMPRIIAPQWHPQYSVAAVDLAIQCLEDIPLFDLYCLPNAESVAVLREALLPEWNTPGGPLA